MIFLSIVLLVDRIFEVYRWLLIARLLMSWVPNFDPTHPVVVFLYRATEPLLRPFRRLIPAMSGFDFSPILVFFLLRIVQMFIRNILLNVL